MAEIFQIFGPPGTGKTTRLAAEVKPAAQTHGSERVLVCSFTKTAAIEIAGRDLPIPRSNVGTLHSFAYRSLGLSGTVADAPKGLRVWNEEVSDDDLKISVQGTVTIDDPYGDRSCRTLGDTLLSNCCALRAQMLPVEKWPTEEAEFHQRWCDWKWRHGFHDFTEMIELALKNVPEAPGRPKVGFFDEAQDFSRLELTLVRQWANEMDHAVLAGDDDQCLYKFRGATPDAFLNPPVDEDHKRHLRKSYRLPAEVKDVADKWIAHVAKREPKAFEPRCEGGAVHVEPYTYSHTDALLEEVRARTGSGDDKSTVMFIASCGYMLNPLTMALRDEGVPFHNPYKSNPAWNPRRGGVERLCALLRPSKAVWGDDARVWTWEEVNRFFEFVDAKKGQIEKGAKAHVKKMAVNEDFRSMVLDHDDLSTLFKPGAWPDDPWYTRPVEWYSDVLLASRKGQLQYAFHVYEHQGAKALLDKPRVIIGSIHSVKGGEADHVYVFPDISRAAAEEVEESGMDAIRRVFYVAITRARESLTLCAPVRRWGMALPHVDFDDAF